MIRNIFTSIILFISLFSNAQSSCTLGPGTTTITTSSVPCGGGGGPYTITVPSGSTLLTDGDVDWTSYDITIIIESGGTLTIEKNKDFDLSTASVLTINSGRNLNSTSGCTGTTLR